MNIKKYIYGASTVMWSAFIYSFSSDTGTESGGKSMALASFAERILRPIIGKLFEYDVEDFAFCISHIMRKCAHFAAFFILAVLLALFVCELCGRFRPIPPLIFAALYAAADEYHQSLVPGRGPAISDVFLDSCGAAVGIIVLGLVLTKVFKKYRHTCGK